MSAGHFDYIQYKLDDVIEELFLISQSKSYTRPTLERIETAAKTLHMANKMLNRVDYLVSGDDGEGEFHSKWRVEVVRDDR